MICRTSEASISGFWLCYIVDTLQLWGMAMPEKDFVNFGFPEKVEAIAYYLGLFRIDGILVLDIEV